MPADPKIIAKHLTDAAEAWLETPAKSPADADFAFVLGETLLQIKARRLADQLFAAGLAIKPRHLSALRARADFLAKTDPDAGRVLAEKALVDFPKDLVLNWRLGIALTRLKSFDAARAAFEKTATLIMAKQRVALWTDHAQMEAQAGDYAAAEALFHGALSEKDGAGAPKLHLGYVRSLLAQQKYAVAEAACRAGLAQHPKDTPLWQQLIALFLDQAQYETVVAASDDAIAAAPDQPIAFHLQKARALTNLSRHAEALDALDVACAIDADDPRPWRAKVDVALANDDFAVAQEIADAAFAACPDDLQVGLGRAQLLRRGPDLASAFAALEAIVEAHPGALKPKLDLAKLANAMGQAEQATTLFEDCLSLSRDHNGVRLAYARHLQSNGDLEGALSLCWSDGAMPDLADPLDDKAPLPHAFLLALNLLIALEKTAWIGVLIERSVTIAPTLPAKDHAQLARIAEFREDFTAAEALLASLMAREELPAAAALMIMERAHATQDAGLSADVEAQLLTKLPPEELPTFQARHAELCVGPDAAVAAIRSLPMAKRPKSDARLLAQLLLAAGQTNLAYRYLRFCLRRWPDEVDFRGRLVDAALNSIGPERAADHVAEAEAAFPHRDLHHIRGRFLMRLGRLEEARDLLLGKWQDGTLRLPMKNFLHILLSVGDIENGTVASQDFRGQPKPNRSMSYHFNLTHLGSLLNELRVLDLQKAYEGDTPDASLAEGFFKRASEVLTANEADLMRPKTGPLEIPRRILQYWDSPNAPPEITGLMDEWAAIDGFDYERFDKASAMQWLRDHLGTEAVRAFRLANHVAEESDYFRLCKLYVDGGIYMDSDNRIIGDAEDFLGFSPQMMMYRDPMGAIPNDVIVTKPAHPIIERALAMAQQSLLARESELTWMKTGPGLMSRAVAMHLVTDPEAAGRDLTLVPLYRAWQVINPCMKLPYKNTSAYWNDETGTVVPRIKAALAAATKPVAAA